MRGIRSLILIVAFIAGAVNASANPPASASPYRLLDFTDEQFMGSAYWTGAVEWTRVGKDWHHPGKDYPTVRRFEIPATGMISIAGKAWKLDLKGGDGVILKILLDDRVIFSGRVEAKDDKGIATNAQVQATRGQMVRFIVEPGTTHFCDATHWDPAITLADGSRHIASAGFSNAQGKNGWWYELFVPPGKPAPPVSLESGTVARVIGQMQGKDLGAMAQLEWRLEDRLTDPAQADYPAAIARHLPRAQRLLDDLRTDPNGTFLASQAADLAQITELARDPGQCDEGLYLRLRTLKRKVALANPLLDFDKLLFCKRTPTRYSHMVTQYYGWMSRPGGGLFVLDEPGKSLKSRDILGGRLSEGSVLAPDLSFDGRKIVFAYVSLKDFEMTRATDGQDAGFFHIYTVNIDGSDLRQVTSGPYDDVTPCWLPDGSIAFCSTRRKGYSRCFGPQFSRRWHIYTLFRVDADGSNLRQLSWHDTNEWYPAVTHSGQILYARWDYIDRDAVTHQNLWLTRPDGTNPIALWGNAVPNPHCAFQARPVPNSGKIAFIASAHHSNTGGSVVLLDPSIHDNSHAAIQRLTPEIPFPESETRDIKEYYATPWPLSEKYYLVSYSPFQLIFEPRPNPRNALGMYLLDAFGNRELIYRDPDIGASGPIPIRARTSPPVVSATARAAQPPTLPTPPTPPRELNPAATTGTMALMDVYRGLPNLPRGSIRELRIVQIFPKTTPVANVPRIGVAGEENTRAILGTVPVEADGSAFFEVPANKPLLFQAIDKDGFAYQTMRTITYVQPGESVGCIGCHESRVSTMAPREGKAFAAGRAPSKIEPGVLGGAPFSFVRHVQGVLDRHCVRCHGGEKTQKVDLTSAVESTRQGVFTRSYLALTQDARMVPRYAQRNQVQVTAPGGQIGALGSGLFKLCKDHYGVKLDDDATRRLAAWIDLNAVFYGSYHAEDHARELKGEAIPMPAIE